MSGAFSIDRAEDIGELEGFLREAVTLRGRRRGFVDEQKRQPVAAFLRLFPTQLDAIKEIGVAETFMGFDVIGADGSRRADQLFPILSGYIIARKIAQENTDGLRKFPGALLEIVNASVAGRSHG